MKMQSYAVASEMPYVALSGIHKTRFMYSCNLSHKMCEKYVNILMKNRLLEKREDLFYSTKKGIQFLETYQKLEGLCDAI